MRGFLILPPDSSSFLNPSSVQMRPEDKVLSVQRIGLNLDILSGHAGSSTHAGGPRGSNPCRRPMLMTKSSNLSGLNRRRFLRAGMLSGAAAAAAPLVAQAQAASTAAR